MKDSKKISIDEAFDRKGELGLSRESFEEKVVDKQDELFSDLRSLVFSWREQEDGSMKKMGRLPNGKVTFLDRSENIDNVKVDTPYICAVYERETEAFAKIICEEYMPKINILENDMVSMVWKSKNNKTRRKMKGPYPSRAQRIIASINEFEEKGFSEVRLIFVGNKS